ncbi:hypothetical protein Hypma_016620 [Hypsizygus marmoreus]|uniref:Uncharacterized protein n=1 Tax=Hypsizygus marmoreus TaxID=39966 RepID=A0A369IXL0_HYPMA|nr:hypothetical protein Hypma_016620 [Hypsizygus marmoreus]
MHDLQDPGTEERMISDAIHIAKHNPAILAGWDVSELEAIIEHVIALQKLLRITLQATNTALCLLGDETLPAQATLDIEMRRTIHKSTNTKFKLPENAYHALYIFLPVIALVSIMVLIGKK